jgi:predicted restriction endonuclease
MTRNRWNREQLTLAYYLYCQLPYGRLHRLNPEIIELAQLIGRTPSAVAMKLVNFASLDPAITNSGRKGLSAASNLDREVWAEFQQDWEGQIGASENLQQQLMMDIKHSPSASESPIAEQDDQPTDFTGETKQAMTAQRIKQGFFRRAVLSSYKERCCMSGISEPRLLIASHIVPWNQDKANRLNPGNGLCLSALHDRAFDQHLISLTDDLTILVGDAIKRRREEPMMHSVFMALEGKQISLPEKFIPEKSFITQHRLAFELMQ